MARIFSLSVECGPSRQDAEKFRDYFRDVMLTLADGKEVRCSSDTYFQDRDEYFQDRDGNWWNFVIPEGMVIGGPDTDSMLRRTFSKSFLAQRRKDVGDAKKSKK